MRIPRRSPCSSGRSPCEGPAGAPAVVRPELCACPAESVRLRGAGTPAAARQKPRRVPGRRACFGLPTGARAGTRPGARARPGRRLRKCPAGAHACAGPAGAPAVVRPELCACPAESVRLRGAGTPAAARQKPRRVPGRRACFGLPAEARAGVRPRARARPGRRLRKCPAGARACAGPVEAPAVVQPELLRVRVSRRGLGRCLAGGPAAARVGPRVGDGRACALEGGRGACGPRPGVSRS